MERLMKNAHLKMTLPISYGVLPMWMKMEITFDLEDIGVTVLKTA